MGLRQESCAGIYNVFVSKHFVTNGMGTATAWTYSFVAFKLVMCKGKKS